jgi:hypothetical protein
VKNIASLCSREIGISRINGVKLPLSSIIKCSGFNVGGWSEGPWDGLIPTFSNTSSEICCHVFLFQTVWWNCMC